MPTILVVGATRGLGASIVQTYAADADNRVLATARSSSPPADSKNPSCTRHDLSSYHHDVPPHTNIRLTV
jgi:NAD(P)-dependent dehydrogenase (short-subunit alcohol dehydrogenase family)